VLVRILGVIDPVVDKGLADRLQDAQRLGAVPDLKKRNGLFDKPL
jgi:hypothetical protein